MQGSMTLAQANSGNSGMFIIISVAVALFVLLFVVLFLASRYRRCPSNRILVIWGTGSKQSAQCYHGGGKFVWPVIQDYAYMSLEPLVIEIPLEGALSLNNIR
ncbi:MAG: flotillin family protein, partial [bacterium]|nr:flotillin family protein [bacterium]